MKIRHVHNSLLSELLGWNITLYPFILYKGVPTEQCVKHELVHVEQIKSVGVFKFYITYIGHYISNRFFGMNHINAYKNIPYEIEAYTKESEV